MNSPIGIEIRAVPVGVVLMQTSMSPEQIILLLLITAMGLLALILSFAYIIYGEGEED
jgi:hypothetical protein